jgi:CheY-like chemotaxis protein
MSDEPIDILLVEDNPTDKELTLRALNKVKLANRIEVAKDGAEALDILFGTAGSSATRPPRLVLLDLKLPKVDGIEVLRRIRGDERTRHLPVVILTSSQEERDIVQSYALGTNSYVVKPVEFESFAEAVSKLGLYWLLLNRSPQP